MQASTLVGGGFTETSSLRVGYNRQIRRASLGLGVSIESDDSASPGTLGGTQPDQSYFSFDASIGMPFFAGTNASLFMSYSDQGGGAPTDGDSFRVGLSLGRSF